MTRSVRDSKLDSREARQKLKPTKEPYWRLIEQGLHLGYYKGPRGGTWVVRMSDGSAYSKQSIGKANDFQDSNGGDILAFSDAQKRAIALNDERKRQAGVIRGPFTVKAAVEHYLAWYKEHRKALAATEATTKGHILPHFGDKQVTELTSRQIKQWRDKLASQPPRRRTGIGRAQKHREGEQTEEQRRARKATANRVLTVFKAILNKAFQDDLISDDREWRKVKPFPKVDHGAIRYLTEAQCVRLVNAAAPDMRALVKAALFTGARYGELCRLKVAGVNTDLGHVYISPEAKSGKGRYVYLSDDGRDFFATCIVGKAEEQAVFTKADGSAWGKNHHVRSFDEANRNAKIQPAVSFHDLRHTFATLFANIPGNTIDQLAQILGHADTRITKKHYAHLFDQTLREAVRRMPSFGHSREKNVTAIR